MISKLAKAQESWFFKIIFAGVAVSFISLFGVTGYISSASQNQTVVNVGGLKTSQSAFSYRLNKEVSAIRNIAGDDFDLTEEMQNAVAENILKQIIDESVLDKSMMKNNIHFPKAFIQQILFSRPEFQNPLNGQFNPEAFRRFLSTSGMSEDDYVAMIRRLLARKLLVTDLVEPINVPSTLVNAINKMDNQRKSFKYVLISPENVKIERQITDDEVMQYYTDFGEQFMIAEKRDVNVLYVPNDVILKKYVLTDDLVKEYFESNKKDLDQPEKRNVMQMVFLNKETAEDAYNQVKSGADFIETAVKLNAENANEPTLGVVEYDELAEGLADKTFELEVNTPELIEVADSWQVIMVKEIIPAKEANFEELKPEIERILSEENLYDALRDARAEIDDATNAGQTLDEIAKNFGTEVIEIKGISEETLIDNAPEKIANIVKSLDFNENVFSYGLDEISSAEEFDEGIAVISVKNIIDAHMPEVEEIRDEIIKLWTAQEKNAIAKETAENIVIDIEDGSDINDAAKARNLETYRSEPISRNETFAGLSASDISDLFLAELGNVKIYEKQGNNFVIAVLSETIDYVSNEADEQSLSEVEARARNSMVSDMIENMLKSYANDFKIEVDYRRAGFSE